MQGDILGRSLFHPLTVFLEHEISASA